MTDVPTNELEPGKGSSPVAKDELLRRFSEHAGITRREAERLVGCLLDVVEGALGEKRAVRLGQLGTFHVTWREPRVLRSPRDQKRMFVDGHWLVGFRPTSRLRERLRGLSPALYRDEAHQKAWRLAETLLADLSMYHPGARPAIRNEDDDRAVHAACEQVFGAAWSRAVRTWHAAVPAQVAERCDHLATSARRRWSSAGR